MLREEILDAARELFVTEGYQNISMRKVADRIEYSPTTIYLYFKDKADLIFHLCEETFAKLVQTMDMLNKDAVRDPVERLKLAGRAYIEFGLMYPNHYKVTFVLPHEHNHLDPEVAANSMGMKCFYRLAENVQECIEQGRFRKNLDIQATSQVLWASMHGLTSLLIRPDENFPWADRDLLIQTAVNAMVDGFRP